MSADILHAGSHYGGSNESFYHYNTPNNNVMSYNSGYHPPPLYTAGPLEDKHGATLSNITTGATDCTYWSEDMQSPDPRYVTRSMSTSSDGFDEDEDQSERFCPSNDYTKYYYQDGVGPGAYPNVKHIVEPSYVNLDTATKTLRNVSKADLPIIRVVKRRNTANKKERRRTQSINNAFSDLRECIPNVPSDTKLSKIKTLRLATSYISYLMKILETDDIISIDDFKADLSNHSSHRKNKSQYDSPSEISSNQSSQYVMDPSCQQYTSPTNSNQAMRNPSNCSVEDHHSDMKKSKGRTGWPQHVWALELKQEQL
ncbi:hypothetical protein M8J76_008659 [Diaphorina citri]|nr:hypothetical protein M8J75_001523 [Diaphorina citri]KAI5733187.1 hypothetical protein M8J76_008659 [Diaphorina citri]